jgi:translation initiation factor SUI1
VIACNGTIVNDTEMGEVIQLQGDQRKDIQEFLVDKKEGLELDAKTIKVRSPSTFALSCVANGTIQVHGF